MNKSILEQLRITKSDFNVMRKPESHIEKRIGFMNESYDWKTVVIKNKSDWNIQDKKNKLGETKFYNKVILDNSEFQLVVQKPGEKDFDKTKRFDDIKPVLKKSGQKNWTATFEECWEGLESIKTKFGEEELLTVGWLLYRMAYMHDHSKKNGKYRLEYNNEIIKYLQEKYLEINNWRTYCKYCGREYESGYRKQKCKGCRKKEKKTEPNTAKVPLITYLQMVDFIALAEDLFAFRRTSNYQKEQEKRTSLRLPYGKIKIIKPEKKTSKGYDCYYGYNYGRINTLLTYCNFTAAVLGKVRWSKFAGSLARPPRGMGTIRLTDVKSTFKEFLPEDI